MKDRFLQPPPNPSDVDVLHRIQRLYLSLYLLRKRAPKQDKFGIFQSIEAVHLNCIELLVEASFSSSGKKTDALERARIKVETLKRMVRLANEIHAISDKEYIIISSNLVEISKMINGWIKYSQTQKPK